MYTARETTKKKLALIGIGGLLTLLLLLGTLVTAVKNEVTAGIADAPAAEPDPHRFDTMSAARPGMPAPMTAAPDKDPKPGKGDGSAAPETVAKPV